MDEPVRQQYEAYPYPQRDPREEAARLVAGSPSNLPELNHFLFGGRRDFGRPFRALVAGGGTGDATIMLAQQLADSGGPGAVIYLDQSEAARAIAEQRAKTRGLTNIAFHTGDLLSLPRLGLGPFDYIDCCGVLHHLAEPAAGLAALADVLAEDGGIGLMVYGTFGRTGLYPVQEALRRLGGDLPLAEQVGLARRLLAALPPTNWLRRNPFLGDHKRSDAELVDLLLHARDRAYTVPELFALIRGAGLALVGFVAPARYEPATYVNDATLLGRIAGLPREERAALAETLAGNMKKHVCYLARPGDGAEQGRVAAPDQPEAVPILLSAEGPALARGLDGGPTLTVELDKLSLRLPLPRLAPAILLQVDGRRSLGEIHAALQANDKALDWTRFKAQFVKLFTALHGVGLMVLGYPPRKGER